MATLSGWNAVGAGLKQDTTLQWWQTTALQILVIILIAGIVAAAHLWQNARILQRNRLLEATMRKQTEDLKAAIDDLSKSEARFRTAVETMLDGFAILVPIHDPQGKITDFRYSYINEAGCKLNGKSREQHAKLPFTEIVPSSSSRESLHELINVYKTGKTLAREAIRVTNKDSEERFFDYRVVKLQDQIFVIWRDVSAKEKNRRSLQTSQERYTIATQAAKTGVWDWDLLKGEFYIDPNLKHILGFADNELPNKLGDWLKRIPEPDRSALEIAIDRHAQGRTPMLEYAHRIQHLDGSLRWLNMRGVAIRGEQGQAIRMVGASVDITEQKQAQIALQASQTQMQAILENMQQAFILYNPDGEIMTMNPASVHIPRLRLNHVEEDAPGIHHFALTQDRRAFEECFHIAISGWPARREFPLQAENGELLWYDFIFAPVFQSEGQVWAVAVTGQEISTAKQVEEQLVASNLELNALLKVSESIVSTLDLEPLLGLILDQLKLVLDYDSAAIFVQAEDLLELCAYRGEINAFERVPKQIPVQQIPFFAELLKNRKLRCLNPPELGPHLKAATQAMQLPEHSLDGLQSWFGIPMQAKDRQFGLLLLGHHQAGYYQEGNKNLAQAYANQAAIAIQNAQLYQEAQNTAILRERLRLSRDLHDSVAQSIYSVVLYTEATRLALRNGKTEVVETNLKELVQMAREAMSDMRLLIFELRPEVLEKQGLEAALQARLEAVEARSGFQVDVTVEGENRLPVSSQVELYRIAQEALNNILKHAAASQVKVYLNFQEKSGRLIIEDNGVGFDLAVLKNGRGLGFQNIRERVHQIDGKLSIQSSADQGTRISIEW